MISVVMPAYNSAAFIGEAIESLFNQTFKDFEIVIIDDGSSDNTVEIVQSYMAKDPRIKLIQQANAGVGAARNVGINATQYDWIALHDSDDIALPHRFERQVAAIKADPEVVMWASETRNMGEDGQVRPEAKWGGPTTKEEFYRMRKAGQIIFMATQSALFRKDIALKIGGLDVRFRSAGDTEFWDRMAEHGPTLSIPEPLVVYRLHRGGIMGKRYNELYRNTKFIEARCKARTQGKTVDYEQFLKEYEQANPIVKLQRYLDRASQLNYRNAGTYISAKQYVPGLYHMGLAFVCNPTLITARIWNRLVPKA